MNRIEFNKIKEQYIHTVPVNIIGLANALGISVYGIDIDNDNLSGYIAKDKDGYYICVNRKHPATRQQFTIAHEIGHFILHKDVLDSGNLPPTMYKVGDGIIPALARSDYNSPIYREMETEANKFAAELLMPKEEFIKKANECEDLVELALAFKVSVGAASIRANNLGIEIF